MVSERFDVQKTFRGQKKAFRRHFGKTREKCDIIIKCNHYVALAGLIQNKKDLSPSL